MKCTLATELELEFELDLDLKLHLKLEKPKVGLQSREQLYWLYVVKRLYREIASSLVK